MISIFERDFNDIYKSSHFPRQPERSVSKTSYLVGMITTADLFFAPQAKSQDIWIFPVSWGQMMTIIDRDTKFKVLTTNRLGCNGDIGR